MSGDLPAEMVELIRTSIDLGHVDHRLRRHYPELSQAERFEAIRAVVRVCCEEYVRGVNRRSRLRAS